MFKKIITGVALIFSCMAHAATVSDNIVGLYEGKELVNEHSTGRRCYLYVDYVEATPTGKHCHKLTTRPVFSTDRDSHPVDEINVQSRVTNYHRPEYPNIKTCAVSLDGKTSNDDIYSDDSSKIYNQIFSWQGSHNSYRFDFFVTLSPNTKQPSRTRLHRLGLMSEKDYDCVNLQKL